MTTFLYSALLTAGADKMAATDPHGWTLTLISVSVVFTALIILFFLYSLSGGIFSGKFKRKQPRKAKASSSKGVPSPEEAAAIALALDAEFGGADEAAIALALHLYLSETVHDVEPGFITIKKSRGAWNNKKW